MKKMIEIIKRNSEMLEMALIMIIVGMIFIVTTSINYDLGTGMVTGGGIMLIGVMFIVSAITEDDNKRD